MNDRELLEKAAMAAGYGEVIYLSDDERYAVVCTPSGKKENEWRFWDPIDDNDDAFRLMVDLLLGVAVFDCHVCAESIEHNKLLSCCPIENNDPHAATRRAIVLAAAAMVDTGAPS
jgi:hypothetical protein